MKIQQSAENYLETILGSNGFRKYVHVLLTDRGGEFAAADAMVGGHKIDDAISLGIDKTGGKFITVFDRDDR